MILLDEEQQVKKLWVQDRQLQLARPLIERTNRASQTKPFLSAYELLSNLLDVLRWFIIPCIQGLQCPTFINGRWQGFVGSFSELLWFSSSSLTKGFMVVQFCRIFLECLYEQTMQSSKFASCLFMWKSNSSVDDWISHGAHMSQGVRKIMLEEPIFLPFLAQSQCAHSCHWPEWLHTCLCQLFAWQTESLARTLCSLNLLRRGNHTHGSCGFHAGAFSQD